jgi:hypothetical protein
MLHLPLDSPQCWSTEEVGGRLRLKDALNRKASSESIDPAKAADSQVPITSFSNG